MGRLIRRFIKAYRLSVTRDIRLGTWASPLTQIVASQIAFQAHISANALAGTVIAGFFGVQMSAGFTGDIRGLRVKTNVGTDLTLTGTSYGIHIECEMSGGSTITSYFEGIHLVLYAASTATLNNVYGIHMASYLEVAPAGSYWLMRLAETGPAATVYAVMRIDVGEQGCEYLFQLSSPATNAWTTGGAVGDQAGKLKIKVMGTDKYIALYSS